MIIRPEFEDDAAAIARIHEAAFPTPQEAGLVALLRDAGRLTVSLVAQQGDELVGHITFSPVTIVGQPDLTSGLGLAPLAVAPDKQRKGIGSQLVREGLLACELRAIGFVVVLGEPTYYSRFGFRAASEWGLTNEYGAGPEFMALELTPGSLARRQGRVQYAPEFAMLKE
jgi:putative acetyltransferase